ncbi:MAG TPA: histone-like protein [Candidatus Acidoferrum sp.]|nr:histone-like protein [Candidatus Acidoferrum sp.]
MKERYFSLYDVEQFLKEVGSERINEGAVITLEKELEDTVRELVNEAQIYANYAGRKTLVTRSDIEFVSKSPKRAIALTQIALNRSTRKIRKRRLSKRGSIRVDLPLTARQAL